MCVCESVVEYVTMFDVVHHFIVHSVRKCSYVVVHCSMFCVHKCILQQNCSRIFYQYFRTINIFMSEVREVMAILFSRSTGTRVWVGILLIEPICISLLLDATITHKRKTLLHIENFGLYTKIRLATCVSAHFEDDYLPFSIIYKIQFDNNDF